MDNKIKKRILYSIPILIGAYLIYRQFSNKSASTSIDEVTPNVPSVPSTPTTTKADKNTPISFPIKKGSIGDKVLALQKLINQKGYTPAEDMFKGKPMIKLTEDGIFGPKTEAAVLFWSGDKSIDNQADWNYLNNQINPSIPK